MRTLTAQQRGDLAESMLPVAATLTGIVHGDGGSEDVQEVLVGLDAAQRTALIVVLAGLVDPEQSIADALGWLEFDETGALTVPRWDDTRAVRDLVPDDTVLTEDFVDRVAVHRYLAGAPVNLSDPEFLAAVEEAMARGMSMQEVDEVRRVGRGVTANRVYRMRVAYQRAGRALPPALQPVGRADFTDAEVVAIRERYAAGGVTDLELSMQYGRTRKCITSLLSGASYRTAGGPIRVPRGSKPKEASRTGFAGHTGPAPTARVAQAS